MDPLKYVTQLRGFSISKPEYNPISDWNSTGKAKSTPIPLIQPELDLFSLLVERLQPVYIMIMTALS